MTNAIEESQYPTGYGYTLERQQTLRLLNLEQKMVAELQVLAVMAWCNCYDPKTGRRYPCPCLKAEDRKCLEALNESDFEAKAREWVETHEHEIPRAMMPQIVWHPNDFAIDQSFALRLGEVLEMVLPPALGSKGAKVKIKIESIQPIEGA
jgi:hypothetical protein